MKSIVIPALATSTAVAETLPMSAQLFKSKHTQHTFAPFQDNRIAWSRATGRPVAYIASTRSQCWILVKPNTNKKSKQSLGERRVFVTPTSKLNCLGAEEENQLRVLVGSDGDDAGGNES